MAKKKSSTVAKAGDKLDEKPAYPLMQLSDFRMGLHTDQQSLILGEMMTARRKLEDENQRLREELEDARMMVQLLKLKLDSKHEMAITRKSVESTDTTIQGGMPSRYWNAVDRSATQKKSFFGRSSRKLSRKEAFKNPSAPGAKTFLSTKTKRIVPKQAEASSVPAAQPPLVVCLPADPVLEEKVTAALRTSSVSKTPKGSVIDRLAKTVIQEYSHSTDSTDDCQGG